MKRTFTQAIQFLREGRDAEACIILDHKGKVDCQRNVWVEALRADAKQTCALCIKLGMDVNKPVAYQTLPLDCVKSEEMALWLIDQGAHCADTLTTTA